MKKWIFLTFVFALFLSACQAKPNNNTETTQSLDFQLQDLNKNTIKLSDYQGKKIYIKFWASWCSICLAGLQETDELASQDDFVVLSVIAPEVRGEQNKEDFTSWFSSLGYTHLPVLIDDGGLILSEFGVVAYPSYAFINSDGSLYLKGPGHLNKQEILNFINQMS